MRGRGLEKSGVVCLMTAILSGVVFITGCALFEDERTAKGRKLYNHYCSHCHGETGQQGEGFNWRTMPDPRPRDLSEESAMSTFSDEEIFNTIYRDMRDTSKQEVLDDENYFAVSTMPTFKYTLSEEEIWSIVGYVRTLHGMSLTYDLEPRRKELESEFKVQEQNLEQAQQALEAAEQRVAEAEAAAEEAESDTEEDMDEDAEDMEDEEEEEVVLPEEEAFDLATEKYEVAKKAFDNFTKRPKRVQVARPDLTVTDEERNRLAAVGKHLYSEKYGCNGCHGLNDRGGLVGPKLDRAGFRLNDSWVFRWILNPQAIKKHTRMPNLGVNDADGKALTYYLDTLRAPKPDKPIPPPE